MPRFRLLPTGAQHCVTVIYQTRGDENQKFPHHRHRQAPNPSQREGPYLDFKQLPPTTHTLTYPSECQLLWTSSNKPLSKEEEKKISILVFILHWMQWGDFFFYLGGGKGGQRTTLSQSKHSEHLVIQGI